tara:strand:- start:101 stop:658 length:558 start_codon:yes stop_codon:yes gene_type:complete
MNRSDKEREISLLIRDQGEGWIVAQLRDLKPGGLDVLQFGMMLEDIESQHNHFKGTPLTISDCFDPIRQQAAEYEKRMEESDRMFGKSTGINAQVQEVFAGTLYSAEPILIYFRDKYGDREGFLELARIIWEAVEYRRANELNQYQNRASGSANKSGCASMIVFGITAAGLLCWGVREVVIASCI